MNAIIVNISIYFELAQRELYSGKKTIRNFRPQKPTESVQCAFTTDKKKSKPQNKQLYDLLYTKE